MDEVGLLCTWLLVYGSAAWFLNTPSLQEAYANCLPFFGLDHRLQRKVWQHRQKFTPTWIVVFLKTFEVYNLIYLLLRLCFPAGWSTPMSQDWQLCPNLLGLIFIRWSCQPAAQAPQACLWIQRLNSSFSVFYSLMCQVHYPHELQHGLSLICLAVHLFIGDPWFGLALRVAMMPLGVGLRMGGWMRGSKEQSLEVILFLMNEAMSCFFFLLMLSSPFSRIVSCLYNFAVFPPRAPERRVLLLKKRVHDAYHHNLYTSAYSTPAHLDIFTSHILTSVHIQTCTSSHCTSPSLSLSASLSLSLFLFLFDSLAVSLSLSLSLFLL